MTIQVYYAIFLVLLAIYGLACRYGYGEMKRFASRVERIESDSDIECLKQVLKRQMSLAAVTLPSGGLAVLLFLYSNVAGLLSLVDTAVFIIFLIVNRFFTSVVRRVEAQIAALPASSDVLEIEKMRIVHVWKKRLFPNFD